jgi:hypothetical protein
MPELTENCGMQSNNMRRLGWGAETSHIKPLIRDFLNSSSLGENTTLVVTQGISLGVDTEYAFHNWNELSKLGIQFAINHYVLHKLGYAIARDADTAESPFIIFLTDGDHWEFLPEEVEEGLKALKKHEIKIHERYLQE